MTTPSWYQFPFISRSQWDLLRQPRAPDFVLANFMQVFGESVTEASQEKLEIVSFIQTLQTFLK